MEAGYALERIIRISAGYSTFWDRRAIPQENAEYTERVALETVVPAPEEERLIKELTEATGARAELEVVDRYYFVDKD